MRPLNCPGLAGPAAGRAHLSGGPWSGTWVMFFFSSGRQSLNWRQRRLPAFLSQWDLRLSAWKDPASLIRNVNPGVHGAPRGPLGERPSLKFAQHVPHGRRPIRAIGQRQAVTPMCLPTGAGESDLSADRPSAGCCHLQQWKKVGCAAVALQGAQGFLVPSLDRCMSSGVPPLEATFLQGWSGVHLGV